MPIVTVKFGKDLTQEQILSTLTQIRKDLDKIMTDLERAQAAITRIDTATTEQGTVLTAEAATLQTISDEIRAFLANASTPGTTITPELLAGLEASATKAEAVSTSLKAQADFSTSIAAQGVTNPVPAPVPPPTQ